MTDAWAGIAEDRLRLLVAQNLSAGEIAKAMCLTRNAVIGKCDRLGLVLRGGMPGATRPRTRRCIGDARRAVPDCPAPVAPSPPRRFSWEAPA